MCAVHNLLEAVAALAGGDGGVTDPAGSSSSTVGDRDGIA